MKKSNIIFIVLSLLFFGFGVMTLQDAMPKQQKEERIYTLISPYFPYVVEKRLGGLTIVFNDTKEKMKPTNSEFYEKIASIDRFWGQQHLQLQDNYVVVFDNNKTLQTTIPLLNQKEKDFIITYFLAKEIK